jgi:hypothetical protein
MLLSIKELLKKGKFYKCDIKLIFMEKRISFADMRRQAWIFFPTEELQELVEDISYFLNLSGKKFTMKTKVRDKPFDDGMSFVFCNQNLECLSLDTYKDVDNKFLLYITDLGKHMVKKNIFQDYEIHFNNKYCNNTI